GGTDNLPPNVPALPIPADTELVSQPRPNQGPVSPPPRPSFGIAPNPGAGVNLRNCDTGKLVSNPRPLNPVVKPSGVLTALKSAVYVDAPLGPNRLFSRPFRVPVESVDRLASHCSIGDPVAAAVAAIDWAAVPAEVEVAWATAAAWPA